jgi:hypothetical protein
MYVCMMDMTLDKCVLCTRYIRDTVSYRNSTIYVTVLALSTGIERAQVCTNEMNNLQVLQHRHGAQRTRDRTSDSVAVDVSVSIN